MESYGIEKLKKATAALIRLGQQVTEALEDDKISFFEGASIGFNVGMDAIRTVKDAQHIWNEIKDLEEAEAAQLRDYINDNFDIPDDKIEQAIGETLIIILNIANYSAKMGDIFRKKQG